MKAKVKKNIPYARQSIDEKDLAAVKSALKGDFITRGPLVGKFEQAVADYCEVKYAVAFNSGSTALAAAYAAADFTSCDRVISTPNTFVATVGAPFQQNAQVVFVDIDANTGNLDLDQLQYNINTPSTRGRTFIVPVHFAGFAVDMQRLERMISQPDAVVIEDAAHAIGSTYTSGQKVGCCEWSDMTVFSFHPIKTITTGEGGMVTTNSEDYYNRLKLYRDNGLVRVDGIPWEYQVEELSGNYNFTEFQAALGLSQLDKIEKFIKKRRKFVKAYREQLQDVPFVTLPPDEWDDKTAIHLFVIQIDFSELGKTRDQVMMELKEEGIGTQVHYIPLYHHPFFTQKFGDVREYFPKMERFFSQALTLPLFVDMDLSMVKEVSAKLKNVLQ